MARALDLVFSEGAVRYIIQLLEEAHDQLNPPHEDEFGESLLLEIDNLKDILAYHTRKANEYIKSIEIQKALKAQEANKAEVLRKEAIEAGLDI